MYQDAIVNEAPAAAAAATGNGEETSRANRVWRGIYLGLAMLFFNATVVVGPFFGIVGAMAGLWATGIALAGAGLYMFFAALLGPIWPSLLPMHSFAGGIGSFFMGIGLLAAGLLLGMGMYYVTVWAYRLTAKYLRFNGRIIMGKAV